MIVSETGGFRTLQFGSEWVQGRMQISRPARLVLEYTRGMCAALLLADPPRRLWIGGLGAGALPRFAVAHWSDQLDWLTVCEIRPDVIHLAQGLFSVPAQTSRGVAVRIDQADAARSIADLPTASVDWLWIDCYDHRGEVGRCESRAFFLHARRVLRSGGVLATNLWSNVPRYPRTLQRLGAAFEGRVLLLPSRTSENVVALGTTEPLPDLSDDAARQRAQLLRERYDLPFEDWRRRLRPLAMAGAD